jgi:hypothetical protein
VSTKADSRQQLQSTELGRLAMNAGDSFERYAKQVLAAFVVAVLGLGVGLAWWGQTSALQADAWAALGKAATEPELDRVAEKFPGTVPAAWAKLRAAEQLIESGLMASFRDRETAVADWRRAQDSLRALTASGNRTLPIIRERALFGLGRLAEMTSTEETQPAIAAYKALLAEFPESPFKNYCNERIAALGTGSAQQFYGWFSKQSPKPADPTKPRDGGLGLPGMGQPGTGLELPPSLKGLLNPEKPTIEPEAKLATENGSDGAEAPAVKTDGADSPANKPAGEEAGGVEPPAAETPAPVTAPEAPQTEAPAATGEAAPQ